MTRAALRRGETVEVGCIGGHGRTGTFLAALLAKVEGIGAAAAINKLRDIYCDRVVESYSQKVMIYEAIGETPPAAPPVTSSYKKADDDSSPLNKWGPESSHWEEMHSKAGEGTKADTRKWMYPCDGCSMDFITTYGLKIHRSAVHEEMEIDCGLCAKDLKELDGLVQHIVAKHKFRDGDDFGW